MLSHVCMNVAVQTSIWSSDDNKNREFFSIRMLFTPLRTAGLSRTVIYQFIFDGG